MFYPPVALCCSFKILPSSLVSHPHTSRALSVMMSDPLHNPHLVLTSTCVFPISAHHSPSFSLLASFLRTRFSLSPKSEPFNSFCCFSFFHPLSSSPLTPFSSFFLCQYIPHLPSTSYCTSAHLGIFHVNSILSSAISFNYFSICPPFSAPRVAFFFRHLPFFFSLSLLLLIIASLHSARPPKSKTQSLAKYHNAKIPTGLAQMQTQTHSHTHATCLGTQGSVHTQVRRVPMRASRPTQRKMHTSSLHDLSLVCEPSVHLFQRTNTPDSAEELLSPFHCSLSSTIESTRWRDKLEQKLNAPRGELEIENHCSCPKPFH